MENWFVFIMEELKIISAIDEIRDISKKEINIQWKKRGIELDLEEFLLEIVKSESDSCLDSISNFRKTLIFFKLFWGNTNEGLRYSNRMATNISTEWGKWLKYLLNLYINNEDYFQDHSKMQNSFFTQEKEQTEKYPSIPNTSQTSLDKKIESIKIEIKDLKIKLQEEKSEYAAGIKIKQTIMKELKDFEMDSTKRDLEYFNMKQ